MSGTASTDPAAPIPALFAPHGDLGRDLAAVDWAATPLGPPAGWPPSLVTAVRILLTSRFAMWMGYGPELTFLCNDAYRRDTLGKKYPWALGRPAREVWSEIWPDIGPRIALVMESGVATWDEALMLFLERSGYVEETYHTFSYSPLADDTGAAAGMLCVVAEETERIIGQRRLGTLLGLRAQSSVAGDDRTAVAAAGLELARNPACLPFTVTYLFDGDAAEGVPRLAGVTGVPPGHLLAAPVLGPDSRWPVEELRAGRAVEITDLTALAPLPTGAWDEPPERALVLPVHQQGRPRPYGFLAVGLNRFRPLDDGYRAFLDSIASQMAEDVTAARALDAERRRAAALAELDQAKTTFFTNVSHELRTPLTLLLAPAEDALRDAEHPLPPVQRHRLEVIDRSAQRLHKLVGTLLDFARLESGRTTAHFTALDLGHETAALTSMFETAAQRAGLTLTFAADPLPGPVFADREMWAKIVLNLLSNALKFTFEGGVSVVLRGEAEGAVLTVTDTGVGIAADELPRLFERFHRVQGARSRTHEGTGIGLALAAELAELHGGRVDVESVPGEGTSFSVRLPYGSAHLPPDQVGRDVLGDGDVRAQLRGFVDEALLWTDGEPVAPAGPPAGGAAETAPRASVLVVDDNADMRAYIDRLLRDEYDVRTAGDGVAALELARRHTPDLVLTDVMMPRLDGFGLLKALHAEPATSGVPVLMLSARSGEEGTVDGLEAGASDYLVKPFTARELRARVRANLELDRVRRTRDQLQEARARLDQAQRLAGVGSWDVDLVSGRMHGSDELLRQLGVTAEELDTTSFADVVTRHVHPDDLERARAAFAAAGSGGRLDHEVRLVGRDGTVRHFRTLGEAETDAAGRVVRLRGSNQDVTEQRAVQAALATAAAAREVAAHEALIAGQLQRSLLPQDHFELEHLRVGAAYEAGEAGTQVGGDWYDVIELSAGRTALVIGDVMGRGVPAAAVMGQLRAAVRAYARLDLAPAAILALLDAAVTELGDDQIVTCVYAVYDPMDATLTFANAGHLPPLLHRPGAVPQRLEGRAGPPLGTGPLHLTDARVAFGPGSALALYTDGLVERRTRDIDAGIDALAAALPQAGDPVEERPAALLSGLLEGGASDDVALLIAVASPAAPPPLVRAVPPVPESVAAVRHEAEDALAGWGVEPALRADLALLVTELVTNALVHGRAPIELRLRRDAARIVVEVHDGASVLPRPRVPAADDENGRGLQLVTRLAERWGTRPLAAGKAVWCEVALP